MVKRAFVAFCGAVVLVGCATHGSRGPFLDATKAVIRPEPGHSLEFGSVSSSAPRKPSPLGVQLLRTDRRQYRRLETISYDVGLENVSSTPVVIPWSPVPINRRDRPTSGYRHALFALTFDESRQADVYTGSFVLYGAPAVPNSLKRLRPGERVIVRLPAIVLPTYRGDASDPTRRSPVDLLAKVSISIHAPGDPSFEAVAIEHSTNALPLTIVPTIPAVDTRPRDRPPVISRISEQHTSPGCGVSVEGCRLSTAAADFPKVYFVRGDVRLEAVLSGASFQPNRPDGPEDLAVYVPAETTPGEWQVEIEADGWTSAPFPVYLGEWAPVRVDGISPERVNPGGDFTIWGANFREDDAIEFIDSQGSIQRTHSTTVGTSVGGGVPIGTPDGVSTVRIRSKKGDADVISRSLTLVVTAKPLPLQLFTADMVSVAAGQWTDLRVEMNGALERSERTEVEFTQAGRAVIVATARPDGTRLQLPSSLVPGSVTLRTRTWRGGVGSEWSKPGNYTVSGGAVGPAVDSILVGPERQFVSLSAGPERPVELRAAAGDDLVLIGHFPVRAPNRLRVTLEGSPSRVNMRAHVGPEGALRVRLPSDLPEGRWRLVIDEQQHMPAINLPAAIRITAVATPSSVDLPAASR